jgi:hypothetical protein
LFKWFCKLKLQQQAYMVAVTCMTLASLPKVASLGLVGVERVAVAALAGTEELLFMALEKAASVGIVLGVVVLVASGVYVFVVNRRAEK